MQTSACPVEINSELTLDPRYSENPSFMTNEYEVQSESGVLNMLMA